MARLPEERHASDRAALLRRVGWERTGVQLLRLVVGLLLVGRGVYFLAGFGDGSAYLGLLPILVGALILWDLRRDGDAEPEPPRPLSFEQRRVLGQTIQQEGRLAAVKQLRGWTAATYGEATRDIDAAFPESAEHGRTDPAA